jgi:hypothetical protein
MDIDPACEKNANNNMDVNPVNTNKEPEDDNVQLQGL